MNNSLARIVTTLIVLFAVPMAASLARDPKGKPADSGTADERAIKRVIAGFSDGWNSHDAHAMCASLADDVLYFAEGIMP
jgi:hypothetical protein